MLHAARHSFRIAACAATLSALAPAAVFAQPAPGPQPAPSPAAAPVDEARQHFELGVAAMQAQRWPEAFAEFEASGRIRRSASVALNLGVVLREMRRFVEARVRLQEFNELATPAQHTQHDAQVQQMLTEISRRLGRVRVTEIVPPAATITLDGRRAQLNDANETVIDPGTHALRAEAPGFLPFEETLEVAESATRDVSVHLAAQPVETPHPAVAAPVDPRVAQTPVAQPEAHPFYTRWWFWTAVGAVALAGATTAVVVTRNGTTRSLPTTNGVVQGLALGGAQ